MAPPTTNKRKRGGESPEGRSSVRPSDDRMQLVLVLAVERSGLGATALCRVCRLLYQTSRGWNKELLERGFCCRTAALCSALASVGNDCSHVGRLSQNVERRLAACTDDPAERTMLLDARAFLQRATRWVKGQECTVAKWMQAAHQEPDASFLSRGATATSDVLGARLVQWAEKPQGRFAGLKTFAQPIPSLSLDEGVTCVGIAPDGKHVVSGTAYGLLKIWDVATGAEVLTIGHTFTGSCVCRVRTSGQHPFITFNPACPKRGHSERLVGVGYTPDGTRIVSVQFDMDMVVKIWNAATGQEVRTLREGHWEKVHNVCFTLDRKHFVSGSRDGFAIFWDAATGKKVRTLEVWDESFGDAWSLGISPDGKLLVGGFEDGEVRMWDARTGDMVREFAGHDGAVHNVRFFPDGTRVVSASDEGDVKIWDVKTGHEVRTITSHPRNVSSVDVSPDGKRGVSAASDCLVKIWDVATGAEVKTLRGHSDSVESVCFTPDGKHVVSGSADWRVKIWDAGSDAGAMDPEVRTPAGHSGDVFCVCFSPDGTRVVSGAHDMLVKIWDVKTGAEVRTLSGHEHWVQCVGFSPDGKLLVSASFDCLIKIWDVETGAEVRTLRGHSKVVDSVGFSPDGKRIVSGSGDMLVKIWDVGTGAEVRTLGHTCTGSCICAMGHDAYGIRSLNVHPACPVGGHSHRVTCVGFSPDGKRVVSGSHDGLVKIWVAETGAEVRTIGHSRTGRCICTMSAYGQLRVHPACPVRGHVERVTCVGFLSPDGTKVVSAASDLTVKIWDGDTGELLRSMHGSRFSLDGERVVSSLVDPPRPRTSGCHIVTSCRDELSVFAEKVAESGEEEGAGPVACFVASGEVTALHCHGAAICVGCSDGSLLLLQAPFLAAGVVRA